MSDILSSRLIHLSGTATERGYRHGRLLAGEIQSAIEFYQRHFARKEFQILDLGDIFAEVIIAFNSDYGIEMNAVAEGAGVDKRWIYALNARSELFESEGSECTAVSLPKASLLGQTWDWYRELGPLYRLFHLEKEDRHRILMMGEPGIIGKIGVNSAGIGVCLNFLSESAQRRGLPIHVLMRAILDCGSWSGVQSVLQRAGNGRSGHLFVADSAGNAASIEYRNDHCYYKSVEDVAAHTNHYLGCDYRGSSVESFENSNTRLKRVCELVEDGVTCDLDGLKTVLSDRENPKNPILASYGVRQDNHRVGTLCTVLMDLSRCQLWLRDGNNPNDPFEVVKV